MWAAGTDPPFQRSSACGAERAFLECETKTFQEIGKIDEICSSVNLALLMS